jgi:hypothetical protein
MMNMENILNRDFAKKFGNQVGYLYYQADLQCISTH